jgi:small-conductance mechanosensitive channel
MKQAYFRRQVSFLLAALLAAITAIAPAAAQAPPPAPAEAAQPAKPALPPDVSDSVTRLTTAIETAEKTIQHLAELEEELGGLRVDVETILADSTQTAETLRPELAAVRSQIEKLGPPPGKDGPPEAPALAAERRG